MKLRSKEKYQIIKQLNSDVNTLCKLSKVSCSGYYKWLLTSDGPDKDHQDYLKIKEVFDDGKGKYGWRTVKMHLPDMNHKKIQRIMRKYEMKTKIRKKNPYKQMMKESLEHRIFPNILQREFRQSTPCKVFCTDITYIPFLNTFVYLSVVKDIASGEVVAWDLSPGLDMQFVINTLTNMSSLHCNGAIIHSDQGFHYTNPAYIKAVKDLNMIQSMSAKGKCIDNAPIESFFGHLKDELDYRSCQTFTELRLRIDEYMRYYNHERKQWTRNKMTPFEYKEYLSNQRVKGL
ncbi:MAG: IS3 family transposase [Candidatus Paceibacterota bacterium]